MLNKIRKINICFEIILFLIVEFFKIKFYLNFSNYLFIILNVIFDFLFVNQFSEYILSFYLKKKEKKYLDIFNKIFRFNKFFIIQIAVLILIVLFFVHSNILYTQTESNKNDFLCQLLISLSSLICFILSKNHGELFYINSVLFIRINNSYAEIVDFITPEDNTVEFISNYRKKNIKIKYSKNINEKELILFLKSILRENTDDNRKQ